MHKDHAADAHKATWLQEKSFVEKLEYASVNVQMERSAQRSVHPHNYYIMR
jgi:hypothetical protein